ncbi:hypothetical protein B0H14DRAFT_3442905 [Mycena olivaceomarginata]|nr:hypothetical protein B0H14DRAFT_3442905 [Mycena olivaceomarginata]
MAPTNTALSRRSLCASKPATRSGPGMHFTSPLRVRDEQKNHLIVGTWRAATIGGLRSRLDMLLNRDQPPSLPAHDQLNHAEPPAEPLGETEGGDDWIDVDLEPPTKTIVTSPLFYPAGKGTVAWRHPELQLLNAALDARDGGPEQGLRFEKCKCLSGSYVIFGHDYRKPPPTGPATEIKRHWRSLCSSLLPCLCDDNTAHEVDYDLRHPNTIVLIGTPLTADSSKQYTPRPSRKPSKSGKGKRKAKQDSDSDSSDFEPEEEEPMSPPLKRRREGSTCPSEAPSAEAPTAAAAPATATPVPLFMSDDKDDVPIRGKSRRQRTTTVRSESESESATEDHAAPQARTQLAVLSPKQVMDFVEILVSPVRKLKNERDTRHLFNGTGQLIRRASQHNNSNTYQWDAPLAPPPRPPPHQWDPPLPTSGPPHPRLRVKRPTAASEMLPPPAASSSASLQRPPLLAPVASSSTLRRRPPPPLLPTSSSRDSSGPPLHSMASSHTRRCRLGDSPLLPRHLPMHTSLPPVAPDALVAPMNPVTPADRVAPTSSSTAPIHHIRPD